MPATPQISAIMSTYNGERFLVSAVNSLLKQSLRDFEFIIVDDCSTDNTYEILSSIRDERLVLLRNNTNFGIGASLNRALRSARGDLIAVQDHDDVSLPVRFEKQLKFLETHTEVGLVGSPAWVIDASDKRTGLWNVPFKEVDLRWQLLINEPFLHTGIMFRRRVVQEVGGYSTDSMYRFAEDYEFISRVAEVYPVANMEEPLVCWRAHGHSASDLNRLQQERATFEISLRNMRLICADTDTIMRRHLFTLLQTRSADVNIASHDLAAVVDFFQSLVEAFHSKHQFSKAVALTHRARVRWMFGKHLIALAFGTDGHPSLKCRTSLFSCGLKVLSNGVRKSGRA